MRLKPFAASSLAALAVSFQLAAFEARAEIVETRMLEDSVQVDPSSPLRVVVDDVFGSVRVTGHDAPTVEMHATETVRAKTHFDLNRARADVMLRTVHDAGEVGFLVRHPDGQCCSVHQWDGYVVKYDIELKVPRGASVDLSTVNEGDIVVDGIEGDFEIANVNGAVRLDGLRGTGSIRTVNGPIDAHFSRSPMGGVTFKTINGRIEAGFPADLSADLTFKTMHGEVWTDYAGEPLAPDPVRERASDGHGWVLRSSSRGGVRVAGGGATLSFETLNGEIVVRKNDSSGRTAL